MQAAELKTFGEISDGIILFNEDACPCYLSPAASSFFWNGGSYDEIYEELVHTLHLVSEANLQLPYRIRLQPRPDGPAVYCSFARFGRGYRVVMEDVPPE